MTAAARRSSALIAALIAICAHGVAAAKPWPTINDRKFSAAVEAYLTPPADGSYRAYKDGDGELMAKQKAEIDACVAAGPIEPCIGMILRSASTIDDQALVERALAAGEAMFPVDLLVIPGDRRIEGSVPIMAAGIQRLQEIAERSADLHGASDPRSIRRSLAFDVAEWRAGGLGFRTYGSSDTVVKALGAGSEMVGYIKALGSVALASQPDTIMLAKEAHRILGDRAAPVLAVKLTEEGRYREAERLAFDGYAAISKHYGEGRPETIAAAAILARAFADNGKGDLALPLARQVASAREKDTSVTDRQKLEAVAALAEISDGDEALSLARRGLALADSALAKPQWPVAQALNKALDEDVRQIRESHQLPASTETDLAALTDQSGKRDILAIKSDLLMTLGMAAMGKDAAAAKDYFKRAYEANDRGLSGYLYGTMIMATARDLGDLSKDGVNTTVLLGEGERFINKPDDHPERIISGMLLANYYRIWNVRYAPEHARDAMAAAVIRIGKQQTLNAEAMNEIRQLRTAFVTQVQSNWDAQDPNR